MANLPKLINKCRKSSPKICRTAFYGNQSDSKIYFSVYLFLRERERQSTSRGGAEREGDPESEAAPGSELSAQSPARGSIPRNLETTT